MDEALLPRTLFRISEVMQVTRVGKTGIYNLIKTGDFPKPVRIGRRAVAWRIADVQKWIDAGGVQR
jgi:prophage regulatory protein